MYALRDLQKARKIVVAASESRIAVIGNCSTQFFSQAIEGLGKLNGLNTKVFDTDYNQIEAQLIDPNSDVYEFNPKTIVLWLGTGKLYEEFMEGDTVTRQCFADYCLKRMQDYWDYVEKYSNARLLQMNFPEYNDMALGSYSCKIESTFVYQIRRLNYLLQETASKRQNIYIVDILTIQMRIGLETFSNPQLYYSSKMEISMEALPFAAKAVVDILLAMEGRVKKCIILDLDNTLWGGVIGDDGLAGIEIGEFGKGHVFTNIQYWLKSLKEYGIILAVCSKNDEEIAREPFERHKEMVLRLTDITLFVANWNDKATNIKLIQESLNIGMDSIVFIDDNPFERNLVKQRIPELEVPDLPEDPAEWLLFLQNRNYFETTSYSTETNERTKMYQQEYERKKLAVAFESIDDYLASLEMTGTCEVFESQRYPRIAQLTQRSNQFNLRTIRYTENDIQMIAEDSSYIPLFFTLKDKFGDYGIISIVILKKQSEKVLFIDSWLMSCRVLKRGMEEFVMNKIVSIARKRGVETIIGEYVPTSKNAMVKDLYLKLGFSTLEKGRYELNISAYVESKTLIQEEQK